MLELLALPHLCHYNKRLSSVLLSFGKKKVRWGKVWVIKVNVAAIPTEIFSKHLLQSEKNVLRRCREEKEFYDEVFLDT